MFTYDLNIDCKIPIYEQLYNFIKNDIIDGKISSDYKLPSKRRLANHLKISIITIENAYDQLLSEGYIYSIPRKGFFVTKIDNKYSYNNTTIYKVEKQEFNKKYDYEFKTNTVDINHFPFSTWTKLLREILRDKDKELLDKSESKGILELRIEISKFLKEFRNIDVSPEQIIVGSGSEYLFNIIIQLLGTDKRYGVENPGYPKIPQILMSNNIRPNYIKLDNEGIIIDKLDNIDILHITPSHQFPLGIVTPVKRRMEILKWAIENDSYIIEDDYDSEFRYTGKPIPALQSMDKSGRVIYLNTFTKNLAPALRISYMVLPIELLKKYESNLLFYSNTVSRFEQHTLARFMKNGQFERYLYKMRLIYKKRIDLINDLISNSNLNNYVEIDGGNVGLHFILNLKNISEEEFIKKAEECNIYIAPISKYYYRNNYQKPAVILGFSGVDDEDIKKAFQLLDKKIP